MNRATRDKMVSGTQQADLTTGNACWETPAPVFLKLDHDFGPFDVDLTADAARHLCPIWFGPNSPANECDALMANWQSYGRRGYSNPPYGPFIQRLLFKAKITACHGFASTLLLPLRVTKAFKAHVLDGASDLLFCDKRLTFFEHGVPRLNATQLLKGRVVADPAIFDSIVVLYTPGHLGAPRVGIWDVPVHVTKADLDRARLRRFGGELWTS